MAEGLFADVADVSLVCDGFRLLGDHMICRWICTGHRAGYKAPLRIAEAEDWDLVQGRIAASRGWHDGAEFARQVADG